MIPGRVSTHLRSHNWFAVGIDLVVVVLGVFIGMQVQDWNTDRQKRARAEEFSQRLVLDMRVEAWAYQYMIEYYKDVRSNAERAITALTGEKPLPDEEMVIAVYRATQYKYNERRRATYDELVSTGTIGLIANSMLRQTAISLFNDPLLEVITAEGQNSDVRKVFRETAPADVQHALLKNCGDTYVEAGDYKGIKHSIDYPCTLGLPPERIALAAAVLKDHPGVLPGLRLRFADLETGLTDLEMNNVIVLRNLRDIAK